MSIKSFSSLFIVTILGTSASPYSIYTLPEIVENLGRMKVHELIQVTIKYNYLLVYLSRPFNWRHPLESSQHKSVAQVRSTEGGCLRTARRRSNLYPHHCLYLGGRRVLDVVTHKGVIPPCRTISYSFPGARAITTHNASHKRQQTMNMGNSRFFAGDPWNQLLLLWFMDVLTWSDQSIKTTGTRW